ncbi:MAG: toll/interleukin-1 receptor domain-containing protein [Magnetococcales bacterium]|nr:toll/interleukin-1 receptor domain-containing protein [Magnetococcales bacterium]
MAKKNIIQRGQATAPGSVVIQAGGAVRVNQVASDIGHSMENHLPQDIDLLECQLGPLPSGKTSQVHQAAGAIQSSERADFTLFISYSQQDSSLAISMKEIIEIIVPGYNVFIFSSPESVDFGDNWLVKLENALSSVLIFLVLADHDTFQRHWINFEVGYAWSRGIPIIFLCHGGLTPSGLPLPYQLRASVNLDDRGGLKELGAGLCRRLKVPMPEGINWRDLALRMSSSRLF